MRRFPFIKPSEPIQQASPPTGNAYISECKFDGFRAQLHKQGSDVQIYSRNGKWMPRFKPMLEPLSRLPAKSVIIDAELVALNAQGLPDFRALMGGQNHSLACMCFDMLELNGKDMRALPLVKRRAALKKLLAKADMAELSFSEDQEDPNALLARLDALGMEGIVAKLKSQPYVSGKNNGWIKVKCHAWRKANAGRTTMFAKKR
jgi:bifunctional non-homologous end joining protein LigD